MDNYIAPYTAYAIVYVLLDKHTYMKKNNRFISRTYHVAVTNDKAIKRAAKKLKISESEVIRRRTRSFDEMVEALNV